ncbi:heavy metal sensor histidine kinase [Pseudomonas sp. BBP2017]|uniref:heavy metal sensor histidine kinase n=1 Tax=Pseudomonas sp. BBP2017 TaxID=2109731 RepID=UPI000D131BA2|nr:heavy metal sensor histidine kinase [Pseudomonas sp. BBP2017]PSS57069.1 two-component sensor histidine kinase [Pseudomonas sp. BBP2017]
MKPARLSLRLGLSVSLMGAALVLLMACLAVLALDHELDSRARKSLTAKMAQIEHGLSIDLKSGDLQTSAHPLLDVVMGHDNLSLSVIALTGRHSALLTLGPGLDAEALLQIPGSPELAFEQWRDSDDNHLLTASRLARLQDGTDVRVLLTVNLADDHSLLQAYLRSTLLALPFLVLLIGFAAWKLVQRGLAPLRRFSQIAGQVSAQQLALRLPLDDLPQELKELAHAMNVMLDRLDGGVQQLSQFSDDLAHELRTPIGNLMGKAQVTLSRERPVEQYKEVLEASIEELTRLSRIINDMLFLAQVSQPHAQLPLKPVNLADEAKRVSELFEFSSEQKGISLRLHGWGSIMADRLMVQRALSNLLSNAIRHSPEGLPIDIAIERCGDEVCLWVENHGPGIEQLHLPYLFERFYRAGSGRSRLEGGTGLGLAIVKSIMDVHGGRVEVSSEVNRLTRFSLIFQGL